MAAFEITHFARNGSVTAGSIRVERTGKSYAFNYENCRVVLHDGKRDVRQDHLRDVRHFVSKQFAPAPAAPVMAPQQCQQQQADAGRRGFIRSALTAGLLAATAATTLSFRTALRGDGTPRLPDHAALWARMPLPFSPAEAWHLLSPATQAEIGAAVIGMELAQYVYGDGRADADQFTDEALRSDASDVSDAILNQMPDRLWALLPDLYGPNGDHPAWALAAGMVLPLGAEVPEQPERPATEADPILAAIEAADAARQAHQAMHEGLDEDDDAQMARLDALVDADRAAFAALASVTPTTRAGDVALADFYLRVLDDPDGQATAHLAHLRAVLAGSTAT